METPAWQGLGLTEAQRGRLAAYREELLRFNRGLNLISRDSARDVDVRHLRHSLTLARRSFPAGSTIVDWGTGGGLPGIPLAICFPDVTVHLVDAVGKKIRAVRAMARRLGLENVRPWHGRAEAWPGETTYSVSRATAPLVDLWTWHRRAARPWTGDLPTDAWAPGLLALKGGDLTEERDALDARYPGLRVEIIPLDDGAADDGFADKKIVEVTRAE